MTQGVLPWVFLNMDKKLGYEVLITFNVTSLVHFIYLSISLVNNVKLLC